MTMQLMYGDCLKRIKQMPDDSIDLIIADPPYFKIVKEEFDNKFKTENDFMMWQKEWILECIRILKDTGSFYLFGSIKNNVLLRTKLWLDTKLVFRNWITWNKPTRMISGKNNFVNCREEILYYVKSKKFFFENPRGRGYTNYNFVSVGKEIENYLISNEPPYKKNVIRQIQKAIEIKAITKKWKNAHTNLKSCININGRYCGNVITNISDKTTGDNKKRHVAEKPIKLIQLFIKASSQKNALVLDPFMGSGTVGVICKRIRRNYIGIEINKKYYQLAKERILKERRTLI